MKEFSKKRPMQISDFVSSQWDVKGSIPWSPEETVSGTGYAKGYKSCAHTHPPLPIKIGEQTFLVYGGAARDPVKQDHDVYVSLDHGTVVEPRAYPWRKEVDFVHFPIMDMSVPKDKAEFRAMIDWLAAQVLAGRSVHVGCIGGHGRTGLVLAALVKVLTGDAKALAFVRANYCDKAVETSAQMAFLKEEFGIEPGEVTKGLGGWDFDPGKKKKGSATKLFDLDHQIFHPVDHPANIWGLTKT